MADMSDKHKNTYREEAYELLSDLEESLLELEENPEDSNLIGRVFRAMHTIKGSGAMFGFNDIAAFTHEVETVFDLVRNGKLEFTKALADLTLEARDYIREMLDISISGEFLDDRRGEEIISELRKIVPAEIAEEIQEAPSYEEMSSDFCAEDITYRITFRPAPDIFMKGINPLFVLDDIRKMGDCKIVAQLRQIPELSDFDYHNCYAYWDIILSTSMGTNAIRDVFIFVEDDAEISIDVVDEGGTLVDETDYMKLGEILVERGDITNENLQKALSERKRLGETLVDTGLVEGEQIQSALLEQEQVKEIRKIRQARETASTVRVPSEKLDVLVDLVGELVTVQARLTQVAADKGSGEASESELLNISEEVERLTTELHDNTMSIRMVPIGFTFSKFRRLVRDLSNELGREVRMVAEGAETELDKTVIERLNDPMIHLIRNCIDHGIEPPEEREAVGKPKQGLLHLSAMHSGANVLIRIMDDGKGLDANAIRAKAESSGLIPPDADISEKDIFNLIFHGGFSMARRVTGVSGRGVGMDVVKRGIESLRGSVDIESRKGLGTTITLRIPLTLAIIEGLLVKIANDYFVFPLSAVEECVELTRDDIKSVHGRHIVNVRGSVVPYIRLRERFSSNGDMPEIEQVVIVLFEGNMVGFAVDSVVGEHKTVIKSLGRMYRDSQGLSGATILGDGTVALILDVPKLIESAELDERAFVDNNQRKFMLDRNVDGQ
jgi:two-component system chemotaxis sensor kinase CheA